ncbi:MAG: hypothetical protein EBX62_06650, partial [Betaproteobacteria bacterium]|nr:hypothetical protein [Betaproteobacteria bacterium]
MYLKRAPDRGSPGIRLREKKVPIRDSPVALPGGPVASCTTRWRTPAPSFSLWTQSALSESRP